MDDFLLSAFEGELETQCRFVVLGASIVDEQLRKTGHDTSTVIWFALQGILVSAANASKLLWGSKRSDALTARQRLRETVEIDNDSPFYPRQLRNDFEHFDERLEAWFAASENHIYIGRNIGPPDRLVVIGGEIPKDQFGIFDPETARVIFWERSVELNPLVAEAGRVLGLLEQRRSGP